jgi:capsular exopolysaccharide synthesis family protein
MDLRHALNIMRRWWWLVLLGGIVAGAGAYFFTTTRAPVYRATATVFVNQTAQLGALTYSDALLNQQLVKTYAQMAQKPAVLETAARRLGLSIRPDVLSRMVSVRPVRETQLFEVSVDGPDPAQDRDLANAVAAVFIEQQTPALPSDQAAGALRVAQVAILPTEPIGPGTVAITLLGALAGMILLLGVALVLEYLDDTVKTPEDLNEAAGIPTLGAVLRIKGRDGLSVAPPTTNRGPAAEAFRLVRANLDFASVDHPFKTLLITSASPSEGKTTTAANLAHVLAQGDKQVLLVDADLRRPRVHRIYNLPNRRGLTSLLLTDEPELDGMLQPGSTDGLWVLPSGPIPANPAELLASPHLDAILDKLRERFDTIIIDSPPVLAAVDSLVLASRVDGTMLVIDSAHTRAEPVRRATEALAKSGTRIIGGVLNNMSKRAGSYYYDYYYYRYETGPT